MKSISREYVSARTILSLAGGVALTMLLLAYAGSARAHSADFPTAREARLHRHDIGARHQRRLTASRGVLASWYGARGERLNARTACGARFRPAALIAAHRSLPCGTTLRVTRGAHSVVVTIADRGPAAWTGRSLDLSRGAAARLAMLRQGVARVRVTVLD